MRAGALFRGLPRPFVMLWIGSLVNRLGGFVVPFLAIYLTQARGYPIERVGLIASLSGAGTFLAGPAGGWLSDKAGRKIVMLSSLCLGAAGALWLGFAGSGLSVAAAVFCIAFFGGMYGPAASAAVADLVAPEQRARAFGLLYWAVNLGFSAAMSVAGLLIGYGYLVLFVVDAATTLMFALLVVFCVPETRPEAARTGGGSVVAPFRDGRFALFFLLMFGVGIIYMQANSTMPVDMQRHGIPATHYGYLIALNGVLVAVLQPLAGRWILSRPPAAVLAAASLLTGLGFGLNGLAGSVPLYTAAIVLWTLGEVLGAPVGPSVVAELAPASLRGTYQGAFQMCWGAGSFVAPMAGAYLMGRFGAPTLWAACFVLGIAVTLGHLRVTGRIASGGR